MRNILNKRPPQGLRTAQVWRMTMPRVLNKRRDGLPALAVYIGRPSKWGNPFTIGRDGSREEVIDKYREYIKGNPKLLDAAINELRGKDLVCWCSPKPCHGDVLLALVNV